MIRRRLLTKYFSSKDRHHFMSGRFRFGALRGYREEEGEKLRRDYGVVPARMSDPFDGFKPVYIEKESFPYGSKALSTHEVRTLLVEESSLFVRANFHVFCCSIGDYDPLHHAALRDGLEFFGEWVYGPNPDLDDYCVIDAELFEAAMNELKPREEVLCPFVGAEVYYFDDHLRWPSGLSSVEFREQAAKLIVAFNKHTYFLPEKEYRYVSFFEEGPCVTITQEHVLIESEALARSILYYGPPAQ